MPLISEIVEFLEQYAPPELAEDWDNVGLLVGRAETPVNSILTCLTLTPDVAEEAVERGVQLIVTHHPVLFRGTQRVTDGTSEGRLLLKLIEHKVAVYSPHTSFDSAAQGINQSLSESFGLNSVMPIRPGEGTPDAGSGRWGILSENIALHEFLKMASMAVGADYLEYSGDPGAVVSTVAVACGSGAGFLDDAVRLGCDTFVTGEARFHSALAARDQGIALVLLGHYASERPAVESLARVLNEAFRGLNVFASLVERNPLSVYMP